MIFNTGGDLLFLWSWIRPFLSLGEFVTPLMVEALWVKHEPTFPSSKKMTGLHFKPFSLLFLGAFWFVLEIFEEP